MRAGTLRHRVTFQTRVTTQDEYGAPADTWTDAFANIAASIEPLSGRELLAAQAVQNESQLRVKIRFVSGIVPGMRIMFNSRIFNIIHISNIDERNRELHLLCSEGLTNG